MSSAAALAFKTIERSAIRTKRVAARLDRQVNARMRIPVGVLGHRAMQREVGFGDLDDALRIVVQWILDVLAHLTGESQSAWAGARP